jgi:hypothetical protein
LPDIDPDILEETCIQGELPVESTGSRSGTITDDDCTDGFDDGFWEGWVRVSEERSYTIEISSGFDSWFTVVRINDVDDIDDDTIDEIAEVDDGTKESDALVPGPSRPLPSTAGSCPDTITARPARTR